MKRKKYELQEQMEGRKRKQEAEEESVGKMG